MSDSLKQQLNKQLSQLKAERLSFEPHWRELSDFTVRAAPASPPRKLTVVIAATARLLTQLPLWRRVPYPAA